jgi:hypothetical protein
MKLDVVCVCCTRGALISHAAEGMDINLIDASFKWDRIWEHKKKIPDAQNSIIERALKLNPEWIWMVEEDVEAPDAALEKMLRQAQGNGIKVVSANYKLEGGTWCCQKSETGDLMWSGLGCILIHASVFDVMERPWFRSDVAYTFDLVTGKLKGPYTERTSNYGRLDVHFFAQLKKLGIEAELSSVECKHWKVRKYGKPDTNDGCHVLEAL